jgi:hypothetical protein
MARRSQYKPELCSLLVEHLSSGLTFESFGAVAGVSKQTLYVYLDKHPAFVEAKELGEMHGRLFWEKLGRAGAAGKVKNFNVSAWIFTMKNRFGWRDRQDLAHSTPDGPLKIEEQQTITIGDKVIKFS